MQFGPKIVGSAGAHNGAEGDARAVWESNYGFHNRRRPRQVTAR